MYIQAADDSKHTDSPAEHSALPEIVSLVMILRSKYLENALRICSNFAKTEAITVWQVHTLLNDFLKKLLVQRNTKINEKRNGVIMLLWRLRLQENPDHKKVSSLYNTAVVTFCGCFRKASFMPSHV